MGGNRTVMLLGDGSVEVRDRDVPEPRPKQALVRMTAAAVSTGTETTMIRNLRATPRESEGWTVGYSGAGVVEAAGEGYTGPAVGSLVACYGGPYVHHADYVAVSQNLIAATRAPDDEAAFCGIGAVAIHGVRNADIRLGERVGVIGLGVLGQLVAQFARAAGAFVLASDPITARRETALALGADAVTAPEAWREEAKAFSAGQGLDAVIVVAGSPDSNGPAVDAVDAVRFQGRVVIVGNVKTEWSRDSLFNTEASVMVSRAAGPGRYDPDYEVESQAWPLVRWTEGANVRCFVEMLEAGRVRVQPLITGSLPMERVNDAYDRLMSDPERNMALVLRFRAS